MDYTPIQLRYYEIRFDMLVKRYRTQYKIEKLTSFIELLAHLSDANTIYLSQAIGRILTEDRDVRPKKFEIALTHYIVGNKSINEVRKFLPLSPNTLIEWLHQLEVGDIMIVNKFPVEQGKAMAKVMVFLDSLKV